MPPRVTAYLGLGANLGDREQAIRTALQSLDACPGVDVRRVSSLRETSPVGGPAQPDYLNGVAEIETTLSARALLELAKACERAAGRVGERERNAPRELDLDVLLYGDLELDGRDLVVPHPRMFERSFVLEPLAELGVTLPRRPAPRPHVYRTRGELAARLGAWRDGACRVGVVPTMGALHRGHVSLIERARAECDRVLVTIFVNPLQFDVAADLDAYPRDLDVDVAACAAAGADAVFAPDAGSMYPDGFASRIAVGAEAEDMEGASRHGHFGGVATVVAKLLMTCCADRAYFGEKDAQQLAVVRRLVGDLSMPVEIVACPIVREPDGLALSSRNTRLGPQDRAAAVVLHRGLSAAAAAFRDGERAPAALLAAARTVLDAEPRCSLDYLELRDDVSLRPLADGVVPEHGARMLVAATFGGDSAVPTRLIDNMSLRDGGAR